MTGPPPGPPGPPVGPSGPPPASAGPPGQPPAAAHRQPLAGPQPSPPGGEGDSRRTTRRALLVAGLLLLLLLGGCAGLAAVLVPRAIEGITAPIDVANGYLDAVRGGTDLVPYACRPDEPPHPELAASQGQYLNSAEIDGRSFAEVGGSLTLEDGFVARILLELRRGEGEWCVHRVLVDGA